MMFRDIINKSSFLTTFSNIDLCEFFYNNDTAVKSDSNFSIWNKMIESSLTRLCELVKRRQYRCI